MSTMWWHSTKSQGITKVTMSVKFHGNSNTCCYISVLTKVVDHLTDTSIPIRVAKNTLYTCENPAAGLNPQTKTICDVQLDFSLNVLFDLFVISALLLECLLL